MTGSEKGYKGDEEGTKPTLNVRLHKPEDDLFAAQEGVILDCVVVNVAFAWDWVVGGREDRGRARTAARGGGK